MSITRKVGLAAIFLIAIIDIALDITRTVYTVNGDAVGLDVIWDILEATIAVIVSSLPTYKALPGLAKRKKTTLYQNIGHNGDASWYKSRSNNTSALNGVELDLCSTQVGKEPRTDFSSYHSTEGSTDATSIV